jgi:alpha-ketoglutarate-dependent taurine dioxygenase
MINTSPITFTSIDEISNNIDLYKNIFVRDGILVLRDANLSHREHVDLHNVFRDSFGWHTNSTFSYTENHSRLTKDSSKYVSDNNEVMLFWHVEHPHYANPIVASTWNMYKFTTDSENGKTYFVDMEKLFIRLPEEYKDFAKRCLLYNTYNKTIYNFIGYHWISNNPVIRTSNIYQGLDKVIDPVSSDIVDPTEDDFLIYKKMSSWIQKEVTTNLDIRIVHKWKQGDIVMPDMYKMCHAVTGGFDSKDREFTGIWGYRSNDFSSLASDYFNAEK